MQAKLARLALDIAVRFSGGAGAWRFAETLPEPVAKEDDPDELRRMAREKSLSLEAARQEAAIDATSARTARALRKP